MNYPRISFVIPVLNAQRTLQSCLKSIYSQNYPKNKIEIIIADGGSTDNTLKIGRIYKAKKVVNKLKTAEAGKAIALKHATGKYIALIDSDNILSNPNWLKKMIEPLELDSSIVGSEPISFTYRKSAGFIERYSSLIGANDPYAFVAGVYDRQNYINFRWTNLPVKQKKYKNYIEVYLEPQKQIPTIGANGTIFQSDFLKKNVNSEYLFDIDVLSQYINQHKKPIKFAKVKIGIIHTYCESSISKFIRKQNRRVIDYFYYQNLRQYKWEKTNNSSSIKFALYTIFLIPPLFHTLLGFKNKPDFAWFFHPIACQITLWIYIINTIKKRLGLLKPLNRNKWHQ